MRKILIVGAGHSGLQLAHGLLNNGYDVTVITGQTSIEIRTGRPAITQLTMPTALELERELHLDFWSAQSPQIDKFNIGLFPPGAPPTVMPSHFEQGYAVAVDRRVKIADWLEYFEDCGGKVVIHGVTVSDLDYFSRMFDLIVVAVGHGELGALFDHDSSRFSAARKRGTAQALLYDVEPEQGEKESIGWAGTAPALGCFFLVPFLTREGHCHALFMSERPSDGVSRWPVRPRPDEQLAWMKEKLRMHAAPYYERVRDAELLDGNSTTAGVIRPQVRNPVGVLPSGGLVLGISDVVISMDPYVLQGWNHSARCAKSYLDSITAHGDKPFDRAFLEQTFETFWDYGHTAQHWSEWVSTMWDQDLPDWVQEIFGAMAEVPGVGDRLLKGWNYPPDFFTWLYDEQGGRKWLEEIRAMRARM
ncbi:styrene monooxygenase/indole monooxygenase family protein [Nocardiopsis suaedae]|uniref:Oxygenase n=1 Tax=Nocardiopsis suaedae TaxID=3018444 RepID=A0ABT4TQG8_9ACTN|nr:styrene monooxygenase/indole monooxygenase family protein [Nocardiopsis suaedae]MDA2806616.1 oxygenase [Nocardiopsis suaedae]